MPGYQIKQQNVPITGVADLFIRSLLDRQQFSDPLGAALRQGISSATWPLFGLLWPSGEQLAARMALRPVLAGERILELGCGLALPSLVGHRRGADVTASDCHPLTQGFLQANLRLNQLLPMKYRHGHWSKPGSLKQEAGAPAIDMVRGRFDLIIGSDQRTTLMPASPWPVSSAGMPSGVRRCGSSTPIAATAPPSADACWPRASTCAKSAWTASRPSTRWPTRDGC